MAETLHQRAIFVGVLMCLCATPLLAQGHDTLWTSSYGRSESDIGYSVRQTSDGGYVAVGVTDVDSSEHYDYDVYIIKTDAAGDTVWTKNYGGPGDDGGLSVRETADTGYMIVGSACPSDTSYSDVLLLKTDARGEVQWMKTYGGAQHDAGYCVERSPDGGYVVAGQTYSYGVGGGDIWVLRVDANGDTLWTRRYGGSESDAAYAVEQTRDGGYVVAGQTTSYTAAPGTTSAMYLLKTDSVGDTIWTRSYEGQNGWRCRGAHDVLQTVDGGYIVSGYDMTCTDFFWYPCVVSTDSSGDTVWTRVFEELCCQRVGHYSVEPASDGGYVLSGTVGTLGAVQQLLGHRDIKTTMKYAHLSNDYLQEAVNLLGAKLNCAQIPHISQTIHQPVLKIRNKKCARGDLNPRPADPESAALSSELRAQRREINGGVN